MYSRPILPRSPNGRPGLIAAITAFCAPSTISYISRWRLLNGAPTGMVRVISAAYPAHSAPTSISSSSPRSMRRALLFLAASRAAAGGITLQDFKLTGDLGGEVAAFTLTANAKVENAKGGALELLSGPVALTSIGARQKWQMNIDQNRFVAKFDRSGNFPIEVYFNAV